MNKLNLKYVFMAGGEFDCLKPETNTRRYCIIEEKKLNSNSPHSVPAPNALQLLLDDDALASSCQSLAHYRSALSNQLREIYSGAPAAVAVDQQHTTCRLTAPITPSGRAFGLIPEGKSWPDDLINWSTREFRNPADARRLAACWNMFTGISVAAIEMAATLDMRELKALITSGAYKSDETATGDTQ